MDAIKNFAKVTVSTGYDAAATTIALDAGEGSNLPDPTTDGEFNLVWWDSTIYPNSSDDPNVEIVRCTARTTDSITVTRAQEDTSASTKNTASSDYFMILGLTKSVMDEITEGPASSTDNAIARFDSTTGKLLQNSSVTINDGGGIYIPGGIEGGNTYINGNISLAGNLFNRTTGLELINFTSTSSAVNEIGIKNNTTGNSPEIQATGDDTNIDLKLVAKGSGILNVGTNVSIYGTLLERVSTPEGLYIKDSYNNKMLLVYSNSATAAVNYISIISEATGNSPSISASGADTDVSLKLSAKNAGTIDLDNEMNAGTNSIGFTMQTATGDGTTTIDWKLGNHIDFTFGAFNETFTFTAPSNPGVYTISLKQDSVGSRTATWPATVKWPAGAAPTLTTTASTGYDLIAFRYDGTDYYGTSTLDFS